MNPIEHNMEPFNNETLFAKETQPDVIFCCCVFCAQFNAHNIVDGERNSTEGKAVLYIKLDRSWKDRFHADSTEHSVKLESQIFPEENQNYYICDEILINDSDAASKFEVFCDDLSLTESAYNKNIEVENCESFIKSEPILPYLNHIHIDVIKTESSFSSLDSIQSSNSYVDFTENTSSNDCVREVFEVKSNNFVAENFFQTSPIKKKRKTNEMYSCHYCGNSFITINKMRTHLNLNPYSSNTCILRHDTSTDIIPDKLELINVWESEMKSDLPVNKMEGTFSSNDTIRTLKHEFEDVTEQEYYTSLDIREFNSSQVSSSHVLSDINAKILRSGRMLYDDNDDTNEHDRNSPIETTKATNEICRTPERFICYTCDKFYVRKNGLSRHIKVYHSDFNVNNCLKYCAQKLPSRIKKETNETRKKPKRLICHLCEKSYALKSRLNTHIINHHSDFNYNCHLCAKSYVSRKAFKNHTAYHIAFNNTCAYCSKVFFNLDSLSLHIKNTHNEIQNVIDQTKTKSMSHFDAKERVRNLDANRIKPEVSNIPCSFCDKILYDFYSLKLHIKNVHTCEPDVIDLPEITVISHSESNPKNILKKRSLMITCYYCNRVFNNKLTLIRHINENCAQNISITNSTVKPRKQYKCEYCAKTFAGKISRKFHMNYHTGNTVICSICGKDFGNPHTLRVHIRIHTGEKRFTCATCKKHYENKNKLIRHFATHTGLKPYKCYHCGARFSEKPKLARHILQIHDNKRPYSCAVCKKSFPLRSSLANHKQSHGEAHKYTCYYCNLTVLGRTNIRHHIRSHLGYPCGICDKYFVNHKERFTHMRTHRKENYPCDRCDKIFDSMIGFSRHVRHCMAVYAQ